MRLTIRDPKPGDELLILFVEDISVEWTWDDLVKFGDINNIQSDIFVLNNGLVKFAGNLYAYDLSSYNTDNKTKIVGAYRKLGALPTNISTHIVLDKLPEIVSGYFWFNNKIYTSEGVELSENQEAKFQMLYAGKLAKYKEG